MPVDPSMLEKDIAAIKSRRKKMSLLAGDEIEQVERIPMESPTIMYVTTGGIPMGRITRFFGDKSTGKTHLAYLVIAAGQQMRTERFPNGLVACYWNAEGIYDAEHAAHLGVDTKALKIGETKVIEEIAGEMEVYLRSIHLHVIDSTSMAKSVRELAAEPGGELIGVQSKAWKAAMNRIDARFDNEENALILISHVGTKIDLKRRTSYTYPKDGDYLEYASSMNLELSAGSWLFYHPEGHLEKNDNIKGDVGISFAGLKEPDGIEVSVRCKKNRVGRQNRVGKMRFDLNTFQFDTTFELLDAAQFFTEEGNVAHRHGEKPIIHKTGEKSSWYFLPDGRKVQGTVGIRKEIDSNPELAQLIRDAMMKN